MADFATHCQVVVRDLGADVTERREQNVGWLKAIKESLSIILTMHFAR